MQYRYFFEVSFILLLLVLVLALRRIQLSQKKYFASCFTPHTYGVREAEPFNQVVSVYLCSFPFFSLRYLRFISTFPSLKCHTEMNAITMTMAMVVIVVVVVVVVVVPLLRVKSMELTQIIQSINRCRNLNRLLISVIDPNAITECL